MTQEEKELLLKDIGGRIPYQPMCEFTDTEDDFCKTTEKLGYSLRDFVAGKIMIKPYLRPMSSMTEDEKDYIKNVARFKQSDGIHYDDGVHYVPIYQETLDDQWKADGKFPPILGDIYRFMLEYGYILLIDFFNSHHLDYRGLIPRGLALEATENMYKIDLA